LIWEGEYTGEALGIPGEDFTVARLYLQHPDCPVSAGVFVDGDVVQKTIESFDPQCLNGASIVAQLGGSLFPMPDFTATEFINDPTLRIEFALESLSVDGLNITTTFRWSFVVDSYP
jgi:hypothetical protein